MSRPMDLGPGLDVVGRVGDGGGGRVFIVWNQRAWCPMACKVFSSPGRAEREAAVMQALDHPNIVRFFGRGSRPGTILMEYLDGPTLSDVIRTRPRRRLSVSNAARMAIHLGAALTHVHARGFVHLDVKPSNVIVAGGRPVLFDFSSARPRSDEPLGHPVGTDAYMAPEQCRGERVTPAADVFGLGATLYEALTGRLPFPAGTRRHPFTQLTASPISLRRCAPEVPIGLECLVSACLARDPAERPSSLEALLPQLHAFIRSGPPMWPAGVRPLSSACREETRASTPAASETLQGCISRTG